MSPFLSRNNLPQILSLSFVLIFFLIWMYLRWAVVAPLQKELDIKQITLSQLQEAQGGQTALLNKINAYRDSLYALDLVLEARRSIQTGSDESSPYLVFDLPQLFDDLRRILPEDARATQFQLNDKGLLTLPVESVDYASLGRVLRSFKDHAPSLALDSDENQTMFTQVMVPTGAQRQVMKSGNQLASQYTFLLQAQLNPLYWQDARLYPDVEPSAFYRQAVVELSQMNMLEGYPDGYFRPLDAINRAEFFKVILSELLAQNTISPSDYQAYIDLSPEDWHFNYLQLAGQMGLASTDQSNQLYPDQNLARLEALKTILTVFKIEHPNWQSQAPDSETRITLPFIDLQNLEPSDLQIISAAYQEGLLDYVADQLDPHEPATRFEVAYWVWKLKFFNDTF